MALEPLKLSDFALAGSLGTGTTAKVYDAVHRVTGRQVAIKVMEHGGSGTERTDTRERFAREAILLSGVDSRYVGKILGFGFERGQPFLVLERLSGETLDAKLRRDGPVAPQRAMRWIEQLLIGVRDCHDAKVIHRDIKPSNLFLHHDGFEESVRLIDFGVARLREINGEGDLTGTNQLIGSMAYMAPEQFENPKGVGFQADLYAVGVVIYRTLSGRLPFVSRSAEAVIRMKAADPPLLSHVPGALVLPELDWFIQRALRREPENRFQHAREMIDQWRTVMDGAGEDMTDVMDNVGRVDESYAGPKPRPGPHDELPANDDERTLRRYAIPLPSGRSSVIPPRPSRPPSRAAAVERTQVDVAPPTARRGSEADVSVAMETPARTGDVEPLTPIEPRDLNDAPTKSDASLRELVKRELELYRSRDPKRPKR